MSKHAGITQIREILEHTNIQTLLQDVAATDSTIDNWLARLILLGDVPFQNLVADSRLLPPDAIRFFYVDPTWLYALIDGALSIGSDTSLDSLFTSVMAETIRDKSSLTANKMRAKLLGLESLVTAGMEPAQNNLVAGLLLRSQIVTAFPGLKIVPAYASDAVSSVPLRYEALGKDLLIVIFPAVPVSIKIQQPPHGLQFGLADGGGAKPYQARLRYVTGSHVGEQVVKDGRAVLAEIPNADLFRTETDAANKKYVLNIGALKEKIRQEMVKAATPPAGPAISPAEFAMQMIDTPEEVVFSNPQLQQQNDEQ